MVKRHEIAAFTPVVDGYQIRAPVYICKPPKNAVYVYDIVKIEQTEPTVVFDLWEGREKTVTENVYTVAWLEWDPKEREFEFSSCGLRWLTAHPTGAAVDMVLSFVEEKTKELANEYV